MLSDDKMSKCFKTINDLLNFITCIKFVACCVQNPFRLLKSLQVGKIKNS